MDRTEPRDQAATEAIERRRFLKRAGTVVWATPVILTLIPDPVAGQSAPGCVPQGAPCDACVGVNCCIAGSDPLPCCCSDPNDPTCAGVCRSQAACQAIHPGGPASDPDACFYPGGTGSTTEPGASSLRVKAKPERAGTKGG